MDLTNVDAYGHLLERISETYTQGRVRAVQAVNAELIESYWGVGRHIVEFEQAGDVRAEYGKELIKRLAADLGLRHGKGFSRSNLIRCRQFYLGYPKGATLSHQLTWSHIVELLKLDDPLERGFYEKQAIAERWSVPELRRQKSASLFLRLAASQDKAGILQLAAQGRVVEQPADLLREWMAALAASVEGELGRVSQTLTGRIRELAERYATPLPMLMDEVVVLAARVDGHLAKMGAAWK